MANHFLFDKNAKFKISAMYLLLVFGIWAFIRIIEFFLVHDVQKAFVIFNIIFLTFISFLSISSYFFDNELNFYDNKVLCFGCRRWLATFLDYYFVILLNWKLMMYLLPPTQDYVPFYPDEITLALVLYFFLTFYLFNRSFGMVLVGLSISDAEKIKSKSNYWKLTLSSGFLFCFFHYWVFGLIILFTWVISLWKTEKVDINSSKFRSLSTWTGDTKTLLVRVKPGIKI